MPQPFDLWIGETFQTHDPATPIVGLDIAATVPVTVNWNAAGTGLTDDGVTFGTAQWQVGPGPFTIYNAIGFALPPIGRVVWTVETHVLTKTEKDTPGNRTRLAVTPLVQLVRVITMTDGTPSSHGVVYSASTTVRGAWIAV